MVNVVAVLKGGIKTAIDRPFESLKEGAKLLTGYSRPPNPKVQGFVMPVSVGGTSAGALSRGFSAVKSGAKTLFTRATSNPFAGLTATQAAKSYAGKALGLLGSITAFKAAKSAYAGQPILPSLVPGKKELTTAAAGGFNLVPTILGAGFGTAEKQGKNILDLIKKAPQPSFMPPSSVAPGSDYFNQPIDKIKDALESIDWPEYQPPSFISPSIVMPSAPSPSFSFSVGGGMGIDPAMLALLLGGIGAGGYMLGRKRRKKKYKKRKRR